jgi:hypothetical protein
MRTPTLFPDNTLRKDPLKLIVNQNLKESNNPRFYWRPKLWLELLGAKESGLLSIEKLKEEWQRVPKKEEGWRRSDWAKGRTRRN